MSSYEFCVGLGIEVRDRQRRSDLEGLRVSAQSVLRRLEKAGRQIEQDMATGTGQLALMVLQLSPAEVRARAGDEMFDSMVTRLAIAARHPAEVARATKQLADVEASFVALEAEE